MSAETGSGPSRAKIRAREAACAWRRSVAGRVVFTNGVFDLLHPGHVEGLEAARALGDALIVGLNDDASARRLDKGPGRPVLPVRDRARMLAALEAVDCVVPFAESTPASLIEAIEPDLLVKGDDYDPSTVPGAASVRRSGGRVVVIPRHRDYSTTTLLERIRETT